MGKAHPAFLEHGQKVNKLEEWTVDMSNEAKNYSRTTHKIMLDTKNKKWYQL